VRGVCGSGLIALTDACFRAGWIDRGGQFTIACPPATRRGKWGAALALSETEKWRCGRETGEPDSGQSGGLRGIRSLLGALAWSHTIDRPVSAISAASQSAGGAGNRPAASCRWALWLRGQRVPRAQPRLALAPFFAEIASYLSR